MPRPWGQSGWEVGREAAQQAGRMLGCSCSAVFQEAVVDGQAANKGEAHVFLSQSELRVKYSASGETVNFLAVDLIGASVDLLPNETGCVVRAYAYPLLPSRMYGWPKHRQRRSLSLHLKNGEKGLLKDIALAHRWYMAIVRVARGFPPCVADAPSDGAVLRRRHFLVFVNPASGRGHAMRTFEDSMRPILRDAEVVVRLMTSQYPRHVCELVKEADLTAIDCIVVVSGDGLVSEVVNGLMERKDSERAILTPLSIVPAGSGNALAATLLSTSGEPYSVESAMMLCLKGRPSAMDLLRLSTPKSAFYSFLSVSWGIVSDVDLESEVLRCLGSVRFVLTFLLRVIALRRYKGRFAYLPVAEEEDVQPQYKTQEFEGIRGSPRTRQSRRSGRCKTRAKRTYGFGTPHQSGTPLRSSGSIPNGYLRFRRRGPSCPDFSPQEETRKTLVELDINSAIDGWKTIEGEFTAVVPLTMSHIARDLSWFGGAQLDDGLLHILLATGAVSRLTLVKKLLFNMDCYDENLMYIKARAFRLEPANDCGNLALDGEEAEVCRIHGMIQQGKARVLLPKCSKKSLS